MNRYKVLVVDDSPFMRKVFGDVIDAEESFRVVATAADGAEAIDRLMEYSPDIVTMDLEMPKMNGLEALRRIMAVRPTPVIMMSAVTKGGMRDTIKALQYGAIDFIRKPDGAVKLDIRQVGDALLEKLREAAMMIQTGGLRMLPMLDESTGLPGRSDPPGPPGPPAARQADGETKPRTRGSPDQTSSSSVAARNPGTPAKKAEPSEAHADPAVSKVRIPAPSKELSKADMPVSGSPSVPEPEALNRAFDGAKRLQPSITRKPKDMRRDTQRTAFTDLIAIGTSTGGPRALHEVLTGIPEDFPAPILIVQHMPPKFTNSLAQRLDSFARIRVVEARDGETVEAGTAYIAPGGLHMTLAKQTGSYRITLSEDPPVSGHRPSVDRLFDSLIGLKELKRHAVIMTGMGSDGARGMKALRDDGAETTIAEAETTCVVYGMPRSAVELGAASQVLSLRQIAPAIVKEVCRLIE